MSIPDFQSLMLPILKVLAGAGDRRISQIREQVATAQGLSPEDLQEKLPSGRELVFANRVGWALTHMGAARLLERIGRGIYRITHEGESLLSREPLRIDKKLLREYPEYREWRQGRQREKGSIASADVASLDENSSDTPEEAIEKAIGQLNDVLTDEVLKRIRSASPAFLEGVVVDLMVAMGYGGGNPAMGRVTGGPGDGGIDGMIRQDALGLDEIYMQAKRYADDRLVPRDDLQKFVGAIDARGGNKGVFVTTSSFRDNAKKYVKQSQKRIILIDGPELARLMVRHGVGVRVRKRYEIKQIDEDYFDQET
ncbi:MAG: restriction endonuclease [Gammaproteobacteria bacterium]|nr:restriction endonuclease [Gammaproteobacteria bacterium]MCY4344254.1 restriction endonuclease [Gammaproteobacteria bacterium]